MFVCYAETGVTCSWDFSKAEEKEQQVLAAKAARGKARQLKAEKHSQRLSQQREKAAANLARLTQISSDAAAAERDAADADAASTESITAQASEHAADAFLPDKGESPAPQESNHGSEWQNTSTTRSPITRQHHPGTLGLARSLPVDIARNNKPGSRPCCGDTDKEMLPSLPMQSQSLRRLASAAASSPRSTRVPGPVLHTCAAESRDSPSSMQCWQIVRPRPVKNDRGIVRGLSHVNVKA